MATLAQKIETEARMRELLESSGMPQPDEVEYGFGCIRLFFHETKTVVVVDIDEPDDPDEAAEDLDMEDCDDLNEDDAAEDRGPPFMTFPFPGREQRN
jgi:hypothetical protein